MLLVQARQFNKYVDSTIPLTWAVRWQIVRPLLPLLICVSIQMVELLAFRVWLNDRSFLGSLPMLLAAALTPLLMVWIGAELQIRARHYSKRTLKLDHKAVAINPAKLSRIAWKFISGWWVEAIPDEPQFAKLTLEYAPDKKQRVLREWSMVLHK